MKKKQSKKKTQNNKKNNAEIAIVEEGGISAIFLVTIMKLTTKTDIPNIVGIPAVKNILLAILSATYLGMPLEDRFGVATLLDVFSRIEKAFVSE